MTVAFVFPGQGSQAIGMLSEFSEPTSIVKETFDTASDVLGFDLWELVQQGPEASLNSTENTQPALLTSSIALWRIWQSHSEIKPVICAGHSLGEYSALVAAGAIDFTDAVKLVRQRGQLMQAAVAPGEGAMAAILGLEDAQVISLCEEVSNTTVVSAANFNSPGQVVIAGHANAVSTAVEKAKEAGAKRSVILPVSVPSHCPLMKNAAEQLTELIESINFQLPTIPVVQNVDGKVKTSTNEIKAGLVEQLYKPVQWTQCVNYISDQQVNTIIECGPGKVLSGLIKRINRQLQCLPIQDQTAMEKALQSVND